MKLILAIGSFLVNIIDNQNPNDKFNTAMLLVVIIYIIYYKLLS